MLLRHGHELGDILTRLVSATVRQDPDLEWRQPLESISVLRLVFVLTHRNCPFRSDSPRGTALDISRRGFTFGVGVGSLHSRASDRGGEISRASTTERPRGEREQHRWRDASVRRAAQREHQPGTTLVPFSPFTIPSMSLNVPMAARWPVSSTNWIAAATFGPIEPAANF